MAPHVTLAEKRIWTLMRKHGATLMAIAELAGRSPTTIERHTSERSEARQKLNEKTKWERKKCGKNATQSG